MIWPSELSFAALFVVHSLVEITGQFASTASIEVDQGRRQLYDCDRHAHGAQWEQRAINAAPGPVPDCFGPQTNAGNGPSASPATSDNAH
jgi:hypothetical protein